MCTNSRGFTLIELLVVILMIGALSGISLYIINPTGSSGRARDGVRLSNVKNLAEAIESYRQLEGEYPPTADAQNSESGLRKVYITKWPDPISDNGSLDATRWSYNYTNIGNGFVVYSPNSIGGCFKYQSDWKKVKTCAVAGCRAEFTPTANCN